MSVIVENNCRHLLCLFCTQVVAESLDILELSLYEEHSAADSEPQAESVLHGKETGLNTITNRKRKKLINYTKTGLCMQIRRFM